MESPPSARSRTRHPRRAPTLTSVSPTSGPSAGGTVITLTGTNFVSGATVPRQRRRGHGRDVLSATQVRATTPAGAAGARTVQVTNPDGQSATLSSAFTYVAAPTLTSVSPTSGPTTGGTVITINGGNFVVGGHRARQRRRRDRRHRLSATQVRATTPAGAAGARTRAGDNPDGQSASLSNAFTYRCAAPTLTAVSPTPADGGRHRGHADGHRLRGRRDGAIGGTAATSVVRRHRHADFGADAGRRRRRARRPVTTSDGQSATLTGGFTYTAPPAPRRRSSTVSPTPVRPPAARP